MLHFVMAKIEPVEDVLHTSDAHEFASVFHVHAPSLREQMLNSLYPPEEVEDLFVVFHDIRGKDGSQRYDIVHSVFKHEDLPSFVSWGGLHELYIKTR